MCKKVYRNIISVHLCTSLSVHLVSDQLAHAVIGNDRQLDASGYTKALHSAKILKPEGSDNYHHQGLADMS